MIEEYKKLETSRNVISGSMLGIYTNNSSKFYQKVFGLIPDEVTTSTILGTIVHHCAKEYLTKGRVEESDITEYIKKYAFDDRVDVAYILVRYKDMVNALFTYLDKFDKSKCLCEQNYLYDLSLNVILTGTCDLIYDNSTLIDFKTTSQMSIKQSIPQNYEVQLLAYIYLLKQNGIEIDTAKIVYISHPQMNRIGKTGNKLKDYPSQVYEVGLNITEEKKKWIQDNIEIIRDTLEFIEENKDKKYLFTSIKEK